MIQDSINTAKMLAGEGAFDDAIQILSIAQEANPESQELQTAMKNIFNAKMDAREDAMQARVEPPAEPQRRVVQQHPPAQDAPLGWPPQIAQRAQQAAQQAVRQAAQARQPFPNPALGAPAKMPHMPIPGMLPPGAAIQMAPLPYRAQGVAMPPVPPQHREALVQAMVLQYSQGQSKPTASVAPRAPQNHSDKRHIPQSAQNRPTSESEISAILQLGKPPEPYPTPKAPPVPPVVKKKGPAKNTPPAPPTPGFTKEIELYYRAVIEEDTAKYKAQASTLAQEIKEAQEMLNQLKDPSSATRKRKGAPETQEKDPS